MYQAYGVVVIATRPILETEPAVFGRCCLAKNRSNMSRAVHREII